MIRNTLVLWFSPHGQVNEKVEVGDLEVKNEYSHTIFEYCMQFGKADLNRRSFTIVCVNLVSSNLTVLIFYLAVE